MSQSLQELKRKVWRKYISIISANQTTKRQNNQTTKPQPYLSVSDSLADFSIDIVDGTHTENLGILALIYVEVLQWECL